MSESPYIYDITVENFEQIVINGSFQVPVLIDFWADWCQPCQSLMPILASLAESYQGQFILAKINTEEQQEITQQFGVRSLPTVKLFKEGTEVDEFTGALSENDVRAFLDKHITQTEAPAGSNVLAEAQQFLVNGDADAALAILGPAQAEKPNDAELLIAVAQANAIKGETEAAIFALDALSETDQERPEVKAMRGQMHFNENAPSHGEVNRFKDRLAQDESDSEARIKLAQHHILQQEFSDAIDLLLVLMMKDPDYGNGTAKDTLLKIFEMLGTDPLVTKSRRRMFNLLH